MASKLSVHITMASQAEAMRDFLYQTQPPVVKLVDPDREFAGWIAANCPNTVIVGRKFFDSQPWNDPGRVARGIMDMSAADVVQIWEGLNEPARGQNAQGVRQAARLDREVAEQLHDQGLQYVAGSWSVGVPDLDDWLLPEMLAALHVADYIGVHEYSAPRLDDPRGIEWFLLRHRLWYPLLPADCQKPLIITEAGIDSGATHWDAGAQGGWRSFCDAQEYLRQLRWYDAELQGDPYVLGATLFQWGSRDPRWRSYDFTDELVKLLQAYIVSRREPEPPPEPDWEARYYEMRDRAVEAEGKLEAIRDIVC